MLKITNANKPIVVDRLILSLYSLPGIGKTTLAFTADKPILLDADKGSYRAGNRKDVVQIGTWKDVAEMTKDDLADYETIVCDTVGRLLDFLTGDIIEQNPKHGYMGNLSLQGYGVLKGRFIGVLNQWRTWGKDIVLISHMDEKIDGEVTRERFDIQGGSKMEIYKSSDAIAKLYIQNKKRYLDFSPREGSLGKNPAQFDVLEVPDYRKDAAFLGGVIRTIKDHLNKMSEDQQAEVKAIQDWKDYFHGCKSAKEFNDAMQLVVDRKASEVIKAMLWAKAKESGIKFDREAMQFYTPSVPQDEKQGTEAQPKTTDASSEAPEGKKGHSTVIEQLQKSLDETSDPSITRVTAKVTDAELRKNGKKEYVLVMLEWEEAGSPDQPGFPIECPTSSWHKNSHHAALLASVGKSMDVEIKRNVKDEGTPNETTWYSLETIYSIEGVPFVAPKV